mmetsp:Transcript_35454/g.94357  ORF Transcript_35454/g.94357 Transcript_35454/m.94357 type:complete len:130 (-) Transcript_35454:759-1148(-)
MPISEGCWRPSTFTCGQRSSDEVPTLLSHTRFNSMQERPSRGWRRTMVRAKSGDMCLLSLVLSNHARHQERFQILSVLFFGQTRPIRQRQLDRLGQGVERGSNACPKLTYAFAPFNSKVPLCIVVRDER